MTYADNIADRLADIGRELTHDYIRESLKGLRPVELAEYLAELLPELAKECGNYPGIRETLTIAAEQLTDDAESERIELREAHARELAEWKERK